MSVPSASPSSSFADEFDDGGDDDSTVVMHFANREEAQEFIERLIMLGLIAPAREATN